MIHIQALIDDGKCVETVRNMRWPDGAQCPTCGSSEVTKQGRDETQPERQRYLCKACERRFDDVTDTIFAGHYQPLRVWIVCLYFMGLNRSNHQIAQELDLNSSDVHQMTCQLRQGIAARKSTTTLSGEVECDEVCIVAGHKGKPDDVAKQGDADGADGSRASADGSTLETERPPIFGMIQRGGDVVIRMLENVQQVTIKPLIQATIAPGAYVYTDAYDIYNRLGLWGYEHERVCHGRGE